MARRGDLGVTRAMRLVDASDHGSRLLKWNSL